MNQQSVQEVHVASGLTPEHLLRFRWLDELRLSPDNKKLAYVVRRCVGGRYVTDVFVMDLTDAKRGSKRVTPGGGMASSISWSKDGRQLAFVWVAESDVYIKVWNAETYETVTFEIKNGVPSDLDWAPDGEKLVYSKWTKVVDPCYSQLLMSAQKLDPSVRLIKKLGYKIDGVGFVPDVYKHIYVLELQSGREAQLTEGEMDFLWPRWNYKGDTLAFVVRDREKSVELGQGKIYVYKYPGGRPLQLMPDWIGAQLSPIWAPDDEEIAFVGHRHPAPVNNELFYSVWKYNLRDGHVEDLIPEVDQRVGNFAVGDQRVPHSNIRIEWPPGTDEILCLITEKGETHLYAISSSGKGAKLLVGGDCVVYDFSATSEMVAYAVSNPRILGDAFLLRRDRGDEPIQLTDFNPWLRSMRISEPEEIWFKGVDGRKVQGWIIKPVNYVEGKKYPTIIYVHCSMFSWDFNHEFQCLAQQGYVVVFFNQIGTTSGYGQAWALARQGDLGGAEYEEIMRIVDDVARLPYVDSNRMGVTGGSCGGQLTNWIVGHTERFKCAVSQRSISNFISALGTSDLGPEGTLEDTRADPWNNLEEVWRMSPIAYVRNVKTPLLIIHSDQDHRCAIEQAEQLFAALRWLGREVVFAWFEGEGHNLSRIGKPANRIARIWLIINWFNRYLKRQEK